MHLVECWGGGDIRRVIMATANVAPSHTRVHEHSKIRVYSEQNDL